MLDTTIKATKDGLKIQEPMVRAIIADPSGKTMVDTTGTVREMLQFAHSMGYGQDVLAFEMGAVTEVTIPCTRTTTGNSVRFIAV